MAYADSIRTTNPTFENVANLIDGQLISWQAVYIDSPTPTAITASDTLVSGSSITQAFATGEQALILATGTASHSVSNGVIELRLRFNSTNLRSGYVISYRSNTGGLDQTFAVHVLHTPGAGTHTYSMRVDTSGASAYIRLTGISVIKFRNS